MEAQQRVAQAWLGEVLAGAGLDAHLARDGSITGSDPILDARYPIGGKAAAILAACGLAAAEIWRRRTGRSQSVEVDAVHAAAAMKSFMLQSISGRPAGSNPVVGNPLVAIHRSRDGWFHLHGFFEHLRDRTLAVLGCPADPAPVSAAVASWRGEDLEAALAAAGTCGAIVHDGASWRRTAQGALLAATPLVEVIRIGDAPQRPLPGGDRPLSRLKVLDLTRILAGPTCARTLAEHGADVLAISAAHLDAIESCVTDVGHGKRSAFLDLDREEGRARMHELVREADVFSQGYRSGALARRGFAPETLAELNPGIVVVSINCYGHEGPFAERPGFEQLAQAATGWALDHAVEGVPKILEMAPCDYATGYLAALGAMSALMRRAEEGGSWHVRTSLCRTGMWFRGDGQSVDPAHATGLTGIDAMMVETETPWGRLRHLPPVTRMGQTPTRWALPSVPLGHHQPNFADRS